MSRLIQVMHYGRLHAGQIARENGLGKVKRLVLFFDILGCFFKYRMWSNQYLKERFWELPEEDRNRIGADCLVKGRIRDDWQKRFRADKQLYVKYGATKYEIGSRRREKRNRAYQKHYGAGDGLFVENDVLLCQQHYLNGTIKIGKNVLLAKHVFIDYSGHVEIKDNVQLTNGVIVETHRHLFHSDWKQERGLIEQMDLEIGYGAVVGSRAIIMPTCNYIGKHARVGAGAVVTHDIPDYAVAVGVPAKIVKVLDH